MASPSYIPDLVRPEITMWSAAITSLVAIFREGMNATSFSHKFLSYFKIIEAYPNQGPFKEINKYCIDKKISRAPKLISEEMLKGAFNEPVHSQFIDMKYTRVRDELRSFRHLIAHPFIDDSYYDIDTYEAQAELVALSNMLERMAISILEEEIEILAKLGENGKFDPVLRSYVEA